MQSPNNFSNIVEVRTTEGCIVTLPPYIYIVVDKAKAPISRHQADIVATRDAEHKPRSMPNVLETLAFIPLRYSNRLYGHASRDLQWVHV